MWTCIRDNPPHSVKQRIHKKVFKNVLSSTLQQQHQMQQQGPQLHYNPKSFGHKSMSFGQQQNQQMKDRRQTNSPRKPSTMSPSHRRPHARGRNIQPKRDLVRSPRAELSSPRVKQPMQFYQSDSSAPPSPRSLRSERSARSSNLGEPRMNRDRVRSSAKWDPKKKKFVRA